MKIWDIHMKADLKNGILDLQVLERQSPRFRVEKRIQASNSGLYRIIFD
jgi:hypothetical protein